MKKWILLLIFVMLTIGSAFATGEPPVDLIFLPGLGCPGDMLKVIEQKLGTAVTLHPLPWTRIIAHGDEGRPAEELVQDALRSYLDEHRIQHFSLVGHSMGAWLAMQLAPAFPDRIDRLIIIDSAPFSAALYQDLSPEQALAQSRQIAQVLGSMNEEQYRAFEGQRLSLMSDDPALQKQIGAWFATVPRTLGIRLMTGMTALDLRSSLARIQVPVLVLASARIAGCMGMGPDLFEERLRNQFAAVPKYELHIAPEAGHFIMLEEPEWLVERMKAFLEIR